MAEKTLPRPSAEAHAREVENLRERLNFMEQEFKDAMVEVMDLRAENEKLELQLRVRQGEITIMRLEARVAELTSLD